jgi:uncharacterized protein (TIGR02145 family)
MKAFELIEIGGNNWMKHNLDVDQFQNGDLLLETKTISEWQFAIQNEIPAYCYYNNDINSGQEYGRLYNWYAVNDKRNLSPEGFKIPSIYDWYNIIKELGGLSASIKCNNSWKNNCTEIIKNQFRLKPGGGRNIAGFFNLLGINGNWWCSTEYDKDYAYMIFMSAYLAEIYNYISAKGSGLSVRCIKT